jgi:hypothetical protein
MRLEAYLRNRHGMDGTDTLLFVYWKDHCVELFIEGATEMQGYPGVVDWD